MIVATLKEELLRLNTELTDYPARQYSINLQISKLWEEYYRQKTRS